MLRDTEAMTAAMPPSPTLGPGGNPRLAARLMWLVLILFLVGVVVGTTWDGYWHITHVFNGFFSPPHVFIYAMCTLAGLVAASMAFTPRVRAAFAGGFYVPPLPFIVPGQLFLLGAGIVMTGLAGLVFDNFWHTSFGLDETSWSFPHAMIGWSILLTLLGVISVRVGLRHWKPLRWPLTFFFSVLILTGSLSPFTGPLAHNRSIASLRAIYSFAALLKQGPAQHTLRIYEAWNLTRSNPLLIVLAPLWAGAAIAFVRKLDARWWVTLLAVVAFTLADSKERESLALAARFPNYVDTGGWQPLPLVLPVVLLLILLAVKTPPWLAWGLTGLGFGVLILGLYHPIGPIALVALALAGPAMALGRLGGERAWAVVEHPERLVPSLWLLFVGALAPALTGMADLALRLTTP